MKFYNVMICVGPPPTKMSDDMLLDLKEAVEYASHNLCMRHGVRIPVGSPERQDEYTALLELTDTKEILTEKNIGRHLKGISQYLLKTWPEKYEPMKEGCRLLYYDVF